MFIGAITKVRSHGNDQHSDLLTSLIRATSGWSATKDLACGTLLITSGVPARPSKVPGYALPFHTKRLRYPTNRSLYHSFPSNREAISQQPLGCGCTQSRREQSPVYRVVTRPARAPIAPTWRIYLMRATTLVSRSSAKALRGLCVSGGKGIKFDLTSRRFLTGVALALRH